MTVTSRLTPRALIVLTVVGLSLTPTAAQAARGPDAELERTVAATFEFRDVVQPTLSPYCGSATFVRWSHVQGVTRATATYRARSATAADSNGPFEDRETTASGTTSPPFNNVFIFGPTYNVETGYDWIAVNWVAGGNLTCADGAARQRRMVEQAAGAQVRLSVQVPAPTVTKTRVTQRLPGSRWATLGTVTCPTDGACTVKTPKTVTVRINGNRYPLTVSAPTRLGAGTKALVRVRFPNAAKAALAGNRVQPKVKVTAKNLGVATTRATVKRTVRR